MRIKLLEQSEIEIRIDGLGATFSDSEESFKAFEAIYLRVYDIVFTAMEKAASVMESGRKGDAEIKMSKWMEPSRIIGVVVAKKTALKPLLLMSANAALAQVLPERFSIVVDHYPTLVYVFPNEEIVVPPGSKEEDLLALGLPLP